MNELAFEPNWILHLEMSVCGLTFIDKRVD